ncbi:MAG: peptide chain release factor N(5)-glutamine methyltransferase [Ignavibacteria bacterium]|nr:peptide chain release factor N(5)-glutamine methyltransferase [Ignavibacteria bacterium]
MPETPKEDTKIWTALSVRRWGEGYFAEKQIDSPRLTMELMLCNILRYSRIDLYLHYDKPLTASELSALKAMIARRVKREPLQYILGNTEFYGLEFKVDSSVLIPRPETELLVESVIEYIGTLAQSISILDIGTGSGCIALTIAKKCSDSRVVALDISESALEVATKNRDALSVENCELVKRDIFLPISVKMPFDIIVSNPPYVSSENMSELEPELALYEPHIALTDGADGLKFYRRFADIFQTILAPNGIFFVEIGYGQVSDILSLFSDNYDCSVKNDLAGIPRILIGKRR